MRKPGLKPLRPMLIDDLSGEMLWDAYQTWWGPRLAVTRSQYMVLRSIVALYLKGEISIGQAGMAEMWFALNGWMWADRPELNDFPKGYPPPPLDA